jgi:hypothetical protein
MGDGDSHHSSEHAYPRSEIRAEPEGDPLMAFKISMYDLIHPAFRANVEVIWQCSQLPARASFTAHQLRKAIQAKQKEASNLQRETLKKYAVLDDKGEPTFDPKNGACNFKDADGAEQFSKEFEELAKTKMFDIKARKLDFNELVNVTGLQPQFWESVETILDNMPQDA